MSGAGVQELCMQAADKITQCLSIPAGTSECIGDDDEVICWSKCIQNAPCTQIEDFFSDMPTDASKELDACIKECPSMP